MLIFNYKNFIKKIYESVNNSNLLNKIDYTLLNPESTEEEIIKLCEKAKILGVKSVCVLPTMVSVASNQLKNSDVLVCTVISFPGGDNDIFHKITEIKKAIWDGADEIDMVITYKLLHKKDYGRRSELFDYKHDYITTELVKEVRFLSNLCHSHKNKNKESITLKVIVESGLLNKHEVGIVTNVCLDADADFIKTSTGMVPMGAELDKVKIMRNIINKNNSKMKIKASGGIRTIEDIEKFEPYVDRFGIGYGSVDNIFSDGETINSTY